METSVDSEWDENKKQSNIAKHGLDFLDAPQLLAGDYAKVEVKAGSSGERRFLATGVADGTYVPVIYAERGGATRIISFRKARKNEQRRCQAAHGW